MDTNDFDSILNFDPLLEAESKTGKSYKEDKDTSALGMILHIQHAERKRDELSLRDDTYWSMPFTDSLRIHVELGFEVVHMHRFIDPAIRDVPRTEIYLLLWHEDGILATLESYNNGSTVNTSSMFYNWVPNDWSAPKRPTSSGHVNWDRSAEDPDDRSHWTWIGYTQTSEAIRHTLEKMRAAGKFMSPWVERPPLYLGDFSKRENLEGETKTLISKLPAHVQDALGPIDKDED